METRSNPQSGAWLLFLAGAGSVPLWILAMGGRRSSVAAHQLQMVLWFVSLLACIAAPFLSNLPLGKKFGFALLALCGCLAITALSVVLYFAIYGLPMG